MSNNIENMLTLIGPECGIVIDDSIGLIGFWDDEEKSRKLSNDTSELSNIAKLYSWQGIKNRRGDYFKVINANGCILFDEKVKSTGILLNNGITEGYIFILRDYKATQALDLYFDNLFGQESITPAVLIYYDNKLYINNVNDKEIMKKYIYDKSISLEPIKPGEYKLVFKNRWYNANIANKDNNIYKYIKANLRL